MAENHSKDVALFKAVCDKFGSSIPKAACLKFVKACPGCIVQQNRPTKVAGFKPIITCGFGKRGQVHSVARAHTYHVSLGVYHPFAREVGNLASM